MAPKQPQSENEVRLAAENIILHRQNESLRGQIAAVVATIGGTCDEGTPTSSINFLQRLRRLVAAESELRDRLRDVVDAHDEGEGLSSVVMEARGALTPIVATHTIDATGLDAVDGGAMLLPDDALHVGRAVDET